MIVNVHKGNRINHGRGLDDGAIIINQEVESAMHESEYAMDAEKVIEVMRCSLPWRTYLQLQHLFISSGSNHCK